MKIVISSDPRLLQILRSAVRLRAEELGFDPPSVDSLAMAIDEAASNVIRHAYGNRSEGKLALEIRASPDRLEFILEDTAPKVSVETIRPRPLDEVRPGGLGTYFINCFMDETSYDYDYAYGNRLKMVKYLPRKVTPNNENPSQKGG